MSEPRQAAYLRSFWQQRTLQERMFARGLTVSLLAHLLVWGWSMGDWSFHSTVPMPLGYSVGLVRDVPMPVQAEPVPAATNAQPSAQPSAQPPTPKPMEKQAPPRPDRTDLTKKDNAVPVNARERNKKVESAPKATAKPTLKPADAVPDKGSANSQPSASNRLSDFLKQREGSTAEKTTPGGGPAGSPDGRATGNLALGFYLSSLQRQIHAYWQVPTGTQVGNLAVRFKLRIDRSGALLSAELVESSGNELFDHSARAALRRAAPFEALPNSISAPLELTVRLIPGD